MANATVMGNIFTIDNPESEGRDGRPQEHKFALLIEFESAEEIRAAIENRKCEFTVFGI